MGHGHANALVGNPSGRTHNEEFITAGASRSPIIVAMNRVPDDMQQFLDEYPLEVAALTLQVREAILALLPNAVEKVYLGWQGIGFHHATAGYVCAIFPGRSGVKIGFEHGNLLHDPDHLLEGSGNQVRYLVVSAWDPALPEILSHLIDQA